MSQRVQAVSILRHSLIAGEGSSRLAALLDFPSLPFSDMLLATGGGSGT